MIATKKPSLADPNLKTTRAKEHLESLRQDINAFYKSKPGTFMGEDDLEKGQFRIRITINDPPTGLPLFLAIFCTVFSPPSIS